MTPSVLSSSDLSADTPLSPLEVKQYNDMPLLLWLATDQGKLLLINERLQEVLAGTPQHELPESWLELLHHDDRAEALSCWQIAVALNTTFNFEARLRLATDDYRWFKFSASTKPSHPLRWVGSCTEIHQSKCNELSLLDRSLVQNRMLDASVDCIKVIHMDGTLSHMNRSGCIALGVDAASGFGMKWLGLLPPDIRKRGQSALRIARQGKKARFSGKSQIPGYAAQYWDNILTPLLDDQGTPTAILCVSREVTLQREAERKLRLAGEQDSLTGLLNRSKFRSTLKRLLLKHKSSGKQLALLLIDLDHFKQVNDTLGHPAGDHLLRTIGIRFRHMISPSGYAARLGGDEFAVLLPDVQSEEQAGNLARQLYATLAQPISYASRQINGGMSIGCALYPTAGITSEALLQSCDAALNDVKSRGRGGVRIFRTEMLDEAKHSSIQLQSIRRSIKNCVHQVAYSRRLNLNTQEVVGLNASIFWATQAGEATTHEIPSDVYKSYDLATKLSDLAFEKAFCDFKEWKSQDLPLLPTTFRISPIEFLRNDFADRLLERLDKHNIPPAKVEIAVLERALFSRGSDYVLHALYALRKEGVRVKLDRYGCDLSSLVKITDYPIDSLSIDSALISRSANEACAQAVLHAILALGSNLSLDVVASGITNKRELQWLKNAGYRQGEGLYWGNPQCSEAMLQKLSFIASPPLTLQGTASDHPLPSSSTSDHTNVI